MKTFALAGVVSFAFGSTAFADVQLAIRDGQVSIVAKDATVRQILTEWAKIGQTKIVNMERVPGGPMTIELKNVSEEQALDVLLHMVSGYMAAPRATAVANASRFDRIIVMPTSAAPRASAASAPPTFPQPYQQPGNFQPSPFVQPQPGNDDIEDDQPSPNVAIPNPRGPIFNNNTTPQGLEVMDPRRQQFGVPPPNPPGTVMVPQQFQVPPQFQPPQGGPAVFPPPGAMQGPGATVPGMIVQPPQQPGQPPVIRQ